MTDKPELETPRISSEQEAAIANAAKMIWDSYPDQAFRVYLTIAMATQVVLSNHGRYGRAQIEEQTEKFCSWLTATIMDSYDKVQEQKQHNTH